MSNIVKESAEVLSAALARGAHKPAPMIKIASDELGAALHESALLLDKMTGTIPAADPVSGAHAEASKYLRIMSPVMPDEVSYHDIFHAQSAGKDYFISVNDGQYEIYVAAPPQHTRVFVNAFTSAKAAKATLRAIAPKMTVVHDASEITESVDPQFGVGDTVETIKQGQQQGVVERICDKTGKVYHRHENGRLYASVPSNLRLISKANQVNESWESVYEQCDGDKDALAAAHNMQASGWEPSAAQEELNKRGITGAKAINENVIGILDKLHVGSLQQLDESDRAEVIAIAESMLTE